MSELTDKNFRELGYGQEKRIPALIGLDEFYYGVNSSGSQFFMYRGEFQHNRSVLSTQLLEIEIIAETNEVSQLRITLKDSEFLGIFIKLIYIVIDEIENHGTNVSDQDKFYTALTIINDWKELFRAARSNKLSENRIIGLLGELQFLNAISEAVDASTIALDTWQGPLGNDEDFSLDGSVFEVKSSKSSQNNLIKINSLRQINSDNIPTFLIHQSFSVANVNSIEAINLHQVVTEMGSKLKYDFAKIADFEHKLFQSGYLHDEKYLEPTFSHDASTYYEVRDDFPLIYSDTLDPRISRVKYSLDLDKCKEFLIVSLPFQNEDQSESI
ncbi:PD-(D/E)XK motif protein [Rhodobacteraceae bacterium]|nr:PD-(D/E)XK motif protein [Paracoccaceae bacterium]